MDMGSDAMRWRPMRGHSAASRMANQLPGRNTAEDCVIWGKDTRLLNQVQLSTYPDCIGGTLANLETFIGKHLPGVVGGVHVLPFYPSSADRGFAPLTYKEVSKEFGTWEEIQSIAEQGDLCVDFMVNHISAQSEQFLDFVEKGDNVRISRCTKLDLHIFPVTLTL
jgi:glycosidase